MAARGVGSIRRSWARSCFLMGMLPGLVACGINEPRYFTAPVLESGGDTGESTAVITLPFRSPTAEEADALAAESDERQHPVPWLRTDGVAVSVLYTITNLSDRRASAQLFFDGASEFASYDSAALAAAAAMAAPNEDEITVLALIRPTPLLIEPGATVTGLVREDDFEEAAIDLDAIGRFGATPAAVLINRSEVNPIGLEGLPPLEVYVRPALFQIQVGFAAGAPMRVELVVRVRDQAGRLYQAGDTVFEPRPEVYAPMTAGPMP